jgi:hypothetical protein
MRPQGICETTSLVLFSIHFGCHHIRILYYHGNLRVSVTKLGPIVQVCFKRLHVSRMACQKGLLE